MKKVVRLLIISVLIVACSFGLFACSGGGKDKSGEPGIVCKKLSGDDFYTVIGYNAEKDANGNDVTTLDVSKAAQDKYGDDNTTIVIGRIRTGAFDGNNTIAEIVVSDKTEKGTLTIDGGAFKNMRALKKITLPFVGANAYSDADYNGSAPALGDELKATDKERSFGYIFGEEEAEYVSKITMTYGDKSDMTATFYIPVALKEVTIKADNKINVPMYAFCGLSRITTVNLDGEIQAIGRAAFKNMTGLKTVNIPASVKVIYDSAFEGTTSLKAVNFAAGSELTEIREAAFKGTSLTALDISATKTAKIGDYAFYGTSLKEFTFSDTVTAVGAYAFANSKDLATLDKKPDDGAINGTAFLGTKVS